MADVVYCPTCGQPYTLEDAQKQGFLCLTCGAALEPPPSTPSAGEKKAPGPYGTTRREGIAAPPAANWVCPACGAAYDDAHAKAEGFLCPRDGTPLERRETRAPRELATGLVVEGNQGAYRQRSTTSR